MDIIDEEYEECWIYQVKGHDSISDDTVVKKSLSILVTTWKFTRSSVLQTDMMKTHIYKHCKTAIKE